MSNTREICTRALSLLIILTTGAVVAVPVVRQASATHDPTDFAVMALFSGWNSTLPPGSLTACSPTGTSSCNPSFREFRSVAFTVSVVWKDNQHNVAIYTRNFPAMSVSTLNACSLSSTNGCLAKSAFVTSTSTTTLLTFTPTVPLDDFTGDGGYEYYCQFHASTMHGKIIVSKSPDVDGDGTVTIVDIATMASAFGSTPDKPAKWNIAADIDNDRDVDIVDIAMAASVFGKTLVD